MAVSILAELGVSAGDVFALGKSEARSVINLLLSWEAWDDALAVLEQFGDDGFVTTMDARARAMVGQGRPDDAVSVLRERINKRESSMATVHLARALIAAGSPEEAASILEPLTDPKLSYWWAFAVLADAYMAMQDFGRVEQFAHQYREASPNSRYPDLIQAQAALLRGDRIGASAYATRAASQEGDLEPTAEQLRTLRRLFASIPDEVRLADTEERLTALRAADVVTIRGLLEAIVDTSPAPARGGERKGRSGGSGAAPAPSAERPQMTDVEAVPVSDEERATIEAAALRLFGFSQLREWQPQIMAAALRGEDVLAILPTGGGKSLTYQLPAFVAAEEAAAAGNPRPLTLVISPLIALMQDQVQGLPEALRRETIALNSALDGGQLGKALKTIAGGEYALVYVAPERLRQRAFVETLKRRGVARLVIDEAHCVSSWGHNFRPDYLHIAQAHLDMGAPPILALTATASTRVRADIGDQLFANVRVHGSGARSGRRLTLIAGDSYRENLHLAAEQLANADEKRARTLELCAALPKPGLVYARSRQACEEIAGSLRAAGLNADYYHAGLAPVERTRVQEDFLGNRIDVLVATVAFGMGVDKSDIRFILHHGLASSLEAYYQEAGRAGRDGGPSTCVLLYTSSEKTSMKTLRRQDAMTEDLLRKVYGEAQKLMNGRNPGAFALEELVRRVGAEGGDSDTRVRVALSALEEAGALRHHYDVPEQMTLRVGAQGDAAYRAFLAACGLTPGEWYTVPFADFCHAAGLELATAEAQLLDWRADRFLEMTPQGRRTLLTLVRPAPANLKERVTQVVERFKVLQEQQVEEIYAYARTRRCRHGHLAAALGGKERKKCSSCDACGAVTLPATHLVAPSDDQVEELILLAVGRRSLGKKRLARLLRGDTEATPADKNSPQYGSIKLLTESKVLDAIERMVVAEMLVVEELESGAVVVKVGPRAARRQKELDTRW
ncbi:MAG: RecQ family ATP-dependent DNA helicase [Caldilineaceae bacterium]